MPDCMQEVPLGENEAQMRMTHHCVFAHCTPAGIPERFSSSLRPSNFASSSSSCQQIDGSRLSCSEVRFTLPRTCMGTSVQLLFSRASRLAEREETSHRWLYDLLLAGPTSIAASASVEPVMYTRAIAMRRTLNRCRSILQGRTVNVVPQAWLLRKPVWQYSEVCNVLKVMFRRPQRKYCHAKVVMHASHIVTRLYFFVTPFLCQMHRIQESWRTGDATSDAWSEGSHIHLA